MNPGEANFRPLPSEVHIPIHSQCEGCLTPTEFSKFAGRVEEKLDQLTDVLEQVRAGQRDLAEKVSDLREWRRGHEAQTDERQGTLEGRLVRIERSQDRGAEQLLLLTEQVKIYMTAESAHKAETRRQAEKFRYFVGLMAGIGAVVGAAVTVGKFLWELRATGGR